MRRTALFVVAASLVQGCAPEGPLGVVGAIVTAPITAPIMFFSARMNDREDFLERARQNQRPLPPIDARSRDQAQATLEQALERGSIDQGIYWQNNQDASGYAAGGVAAHQLTLVRIADLRDDDGLNLRKIEARVRQWSLPGERTLRPRAGRRLFNRSER